MESSRNARPFRPWITPDRTSSNNALQFSTPNNSHLNYSSSTISVSPDFSISPVRCSQPSHFVPSSSQVTAADKSELSSRSAISKLSITTRNLFDAFLVNRDTELNFSPKSEKEDSEDCCIISSPNDSMVGQMTWDYSNTPGKKCHPDCKYCEAALVARNRFVAEGQSLVQDGKLIQEDVNEQTQSKILEDRGTPSNSFHIGTGSSPIRHVVHTSPGPSIGGEVSEVAITHDHNYIKQQHSTPVLKIKNVFHISPRLMEETGDMHDLMEKERHNLAEGKGRDSANTPSVYRSIFKSPTKINESLCSIGAWFSDQQEKLVQISTNTAKESVKVMKDVAIQTINTSNQLDVLCHNNGNKELIKALSSKESDASYCSSQLTAAEEIFSDDAAKYSEVDDVVWSSHPEEQNHKDIELEHQDAAVTGEKLENVDNGKRDQRFTPSSSSERRTPKVKKMRYATEVEQLVEAAHQYNSRFCSKSSPRCFRCQRTFRSERLLVEHHQHHDSVHTRSESAKSLQRRQKWESMDCIHCTLPSCERIKSCNFKLITPPRLSLKRYSLPSLSKRLQYSSSSSSSEQPSTPNSKSSSSGKQAIIRVQGNPGQCERNTDTDLTDENPLVIKTLTPKSKCHRSQKARGRPRKFFCDLPDKKTEKKPNTKPKLEQRSKDVPLVKGKRGRPRKQENLYTSKRKGKTVKKYKENKVAKISGLSTGKKKAIAKLCKAGNKGAEEKVKLIQTRSRTTNFKKQHNEFEEPGNVSSESEVVLSDSVGLIQEEEDDDKTIIYSFDATPSKDCSSSGKNKDISLSPLRKIGSTSPKSKDIGASPKDKYENISPVSSKVSPKNTVCDITVKNKHTKSGSSLETKTSLLTDNTKEPVGSPKHKDCSISLKCRDTLASSVDEAGKSRFHIEKDASGRKVRSKTAAQRGVGTLTREEIERAFNACSVTLCKTGVDNRGCVYRGDSASPVSELGSGAVGVNRCKRIGDSEGSSQNITPLKNMPENHYSPNEKYNEEECKQDSLKNRRHNGGEIADGVSSAKKKKITKKTFRGKKADGSSIVGVNNKETGRPKKKKIKTKRKSLNKTEARSLDCNNNNLLSDNPVGNCETRDCNCERLKNKEKQLDLTGTGASDCSNKNLMPSPSEVVRDAVHDCELDFEAALIEMQLINEGLPPFVGDKCYIEAVKKRAVQGSTSEQPGKENTIGKKTKRKGEKKQHKGGSDKLKLGRDTSGNNNEDTLVNEQEVKSEKTKKVKRKLDMTSCTKKVVTETVGSEEQNEGVALTVQDSVTDNATKEQEKTVKPAFKIVWNKGESHDHTDNVHSKGQKKDKSGKEGKRKKQRDPECLVRCHYCDAIMARRTLADHTQLEHPYPCHTCKQTFSQKKLRDDHIKVSHKEFHCTLCQMNFTSKVNLTRHLPSKKHQDLERVQKQTLNMFQPTQRVETVATDTVPFDSHALHSSGLILDEDHHNYEEHSVLSDSFLAELGLGSHVSSPAGTSLPCNSLSDQVQPLPFHPDGEESGFCDMSPEPTYYDHSQLDHHVISTFLHDSLEQGSNSTSSNVYSSWQRDVSNISNEMVSMQEPWQQQSCDKEVSNAWRQNLDHQPQLGTDFGFLAALDLVNL